MRPRQFDLIAFDWDGTLFDSTAIIVRCIQAAVQDVGGRMPTDEAASYVIGMGLMQALAHAAPDVPPSQYPLLGERYRYHYQQHQNDISLFEGVLPLLAELKQRHHWLTVATGKSRQGLHSQEDGKGCNHHRKIFFHRRFLCCYKAFFLTQQQVVKNQPKSPKDIRS